MPETSYISSVTTAYATAYKSVEELLANTKAAIAARRARDQALMVATLSILTGAVVGAVAEGLVTTDGAHRQPIPMQGGDSLSQLLTTTLLRRPARQVGGPPHIAAARR